MRGGKRRERNAAPFTDLRSRDRLATAASTSSGQIEVLLRELVEAHHVVQLLRARALQRAASPPPARCRPTSAAQARRTAVRARSPVPPLRSRSRYLERTPRERLREAAGSRWPTTLVIASSTSRALTGSSWFTYTSSCGLLETRLSSLRTASRGTMTAASALPSAHLRSPAPGMAADTGSMRPVEPIARADEVEPGPPISSLSSLRHLVDERDRRPVGPRLSAKPISTATTTGYSTSTVTSSGERASIRRSLISSQRMRSASQRLHAISQWPRWRRKATNAVSKSRGSLPPRRCGEAPPARPRRGARRPPAPAPGRRAARPRRRCESHRRRSCRARRAPATKSHSRSRWRGSSAALGSSSSSTVGLASRPIAMLTRWRFPPDSRDAARRLAPRAEPGPACRRPPRRRRRHPPGARTGAGSRPRSACCRAPGAAAPSRTRPGIATVPASGRWILGQDRQQRRLPGAVRTDASDQLSAPRLQARTPANATRSP